ncbi:single-stranded-DNA-specific exonuclease RecJ, partial [Lacticaseibacillus saniviri]
VDNGIAGAAVIDEAMAAGMDVVVTDHHELPDQLPNAVAVVHPRYPGSQYPFGDLSGAGVAFKVATALLEEPPVESVDLAALGAVADLVTLVDENRVLVQLGLQMIRTQPRIGLSALLEVADVAQESVTETTIGFVIGPRLNALGRLGDAKDGVTLLTTFDDELAMDLAKQINTLNDQRQQLVKKITKDALAQAALPENESKKTLILRQKGWHEGVLGIVASRVVETTGKPTLVLNINDAGTQAKGSGRSVAAYHLFNSLAPSKELMTHFGGHHMAVGLTMPTDNIEAVHQAMEEAAKTQLADQTKPPLEISARLEPSDLTLDHYQELRQLAPFGPGNPEPTFEVKPQAIQDVRQIGQGGNHLKMKVDNGVDVIGFGFGELAPALTAPSQTKLAVHLDENTWKNQTKLQLMLKDMQVVQPQVIDYRLPKLSAEQFHTSKTYVFFDVRVKKELEQRFQFGGPTKMIDDLTPGESVVLVDLPASEAQLQQAIHQVQLPLGVIFYGSPTDLVPIPNREEFGLVMRFLIAHPQFDKHQLGLVAKETHLTVSQVIFSVQVFFELEFVTIDGAFISPVAKPAKRALDSAPAYQARQTFLALAHRLQTTPIKALTPTLLEYNDDWKEQHDN